MNNKIRPAEKIYMAIIFLFMYAPIVTLIVLSFNLLGDGLRDAFDPSTRANPVPSGAVLRSSGI